MEWVQNGLGGESRFTPKGLPDGVEARLQFGHKAFEIGVCCRNTISSQSSWVWQTLTAKKLGPAKEQAAAALRQLLHDAAGARLLQAEQLQNEANVLIEFADSLGAG